MLPKPIKWPLQFAGFAVCAWLIVQAGQAAYGFTGGGLDGLYWGGVAALLATVAIGLVLYGLRWLGARLAEQLIARTVAELAADGGREGSLPDQVGCIELAEAMEAQRRDGDHE